MNAKVISILMGTLFVLTSAVPRVEAGSLEGTWNELTTSGGPPVDRGWHSAIYDPVAHRMIVFAGWSGSVYNSRNDTWALDLTTSTWSQVTTTGGPPATRAGHVGVYDSSRHRMVIHGGHNWWTSWRNDTWALDLGSNTWTQLATTGGPPPARYGHRGFYDSPRDRIIIFGGYAGGGSQRNDTWSLDLATLVWSQIATTGGPPPGRHAFAAIYDPTYDRFFIAGGSWGHGDTWELDLSTHTWTPGPDAPHTFGAVDSAFNDQTGRMIIVGGEHGMPPDSMALVFDVWSGTWLEVNVPGATPPIRGNEVPSAIFDPVSQRTIMFGGGTSLSTTFNDTWELLLSGQGFSPGDLNCDGVLNAFDIDPFVLGLTAPSQYVIQYPDCDLMLADINGDGYVDAFDIDPFVELLTGP